MANPRKPTSILKLQGTARRDRLAKRRGELNLTPRIPDPPDCLTGAALEEWHRVIALSEYSKVLNGVDRGMLAGICLMWAEIDRAAKSGEGVKPTLWIAYGNYCAKFGFNPSDRSKVHAPTDDKPKVNKFADLS